MSKKKAEKAEAVELSPFAEDIKNKYGEGVMIDSSFIYEEKQLIIPVSPLLDVGLNGGIPEGVMASFSGKPKCGKTTLALQFAANAQMPEYGSKKVFYIDVEHRLKKMNLSSIKHLKPLNVIRSAPGAILDAANFLNIITKTVKENPGCIVIVDSTSALCSNEELTSDIEGKTRPEVPGMLAKWTRQMSQILGLQKCVVILIQHVMQNQASKNGGVIEDGGQKVQYHGDVKIRSKWVEKWVPTGYDKPVGQVCHWDIVWGALGQPTDADGYIRYGDGIDYITESIMVGADLGLIDKSGAWFTCAFVEDTPKFQGQEKLRNYLVENPQHVVTLQAKIRETMGYGSIRA